MESDILGIDLAKHVFQLHGADPRGRAVYRAKVWRGSLIETVRTLKPRMVVMEACSTADHWARRFQSLGIEARLTSPQYVTPFVKTNKNDLNDAEAIVETARRPTVFVNVVVMSLHAHCFNSTGGIRSGLSQTSSFNSQLRVERDQRCGLRAFACA